MNLRKRRQLLLYGVMGALSSQTLGLPFLNADEPPSADEPEKFGEFRRVSVVVNTPRDISRYIDPLTGKPGISILAFVKLPLNPMPGIVEIYLISLNCTILGGQFEIQFEGRRLHWLQIPLLGLNTRKLRAYRYRLTVKTDDPAIAHLMEEAFDPNPNAKDWKIIVYPNLIK